MMLVERRLGEAVEELEVDRCMTDTSMQSKVSAREFDAAVLSTCQQFEHRLITIGAIASSMEGHMQVLVFQERLQHMTERLARD